MDIFEIIKREHEFINIELRDLELAINLEPINYSALIHVFMELHTFWDLHEEKEETIFQVLKKNKVQLPVVKVDFEHGDLRKRRLEILDIIGSGKGDSDVAYLKDKIKELISKIRVHIEQENWIFVGLGWESAEPMFTGETENLKKFNDLNKKIISLFNEKVDYSGLVE